MAPPTTSKLPDLQQSSSCIEQATPALSSQTAQETSADGATRGNETVDETSNLTQFHPSLSEPTLQHSHQSNALRSQATGESDEPGGTDGDDERQRSGVDEGPTLPLPEPAPPLRKLSSLKWPYVPDTSSYPDPLTRDDPKPLNLTQYQAIASSPAVRRALASHARLPTLLRSIDQLRGPDREAALERVLGVTPAQSSGFSLAGLSASAQADLHPATRFARDGSSGGSGRGVGSIVGEEADAEDMRALRSLAEAVEAAVRGTSERDNPLGLDWKA
ncbi:hypothetical protein EW145_g3588 [Phellinidium pouzarii]|uniref:Uncharacterized protein n=1 Tax=Phellinidium pouzarii TaxID=167371 RepID=A0A4S4L6L0_9AGAM|nr:hypothetical protein EW145_g3588 [Phellinidium pouzarii]